MKLLILALLAVPLYAQPVIVNAANGSSANFAPGSLILVGSTLTPTLTLTLAPSTPIPIIGAVAQNIFLARLPVDLPLGAATINGAVINIVPNSFGMFTGTIKAGLAVFGSGGNTMWSVIVQPGPHFAQKNSGPSAGLTQPVHPGDYLTIYGTGLGQTPMNQVAVAVAGLPVPVTYAGPAPGQPGVDQINIHIPDAFTAPDSCYDAFAVTIAGAVVAPMGLPFTESAATCPSSAGFNRTELAQIDAGSQINSVSLNLQSAIRPATAQDGVGAGFTRGEFASLFSSSLPQLLNWADSIFYSCRPQQSGLLAQATFGVYPSLAMSLGSETIRIGPGVAGPPLPTAVPNPDTLPPSLFQSGNWQLTADQFSQPLYIPPAIQLQNFAALQSIDSTRDLTITWNAAGYSPSDVLTLTLAAPANEWFSSPSSVCQARATTGSITVPAAQLQAIPTSAILTAFISPHPDQTPNFRLPQPDGSTLPLQVRYFFSETFPVTLH
jgi:uncharacterized protein (TIGR03437 family)